MLSEKAYDLIVQVIISDQFTPHCMGLKFGPMHPSIIKAVVRTLRMMSRFRRKLRS
jgi:hypothetical protein